MNETLVPRTVEPEAQAGALEALREASPNTNAVQARTNTVATLLSKAYEEASKLRLTPEEATALVAPFPDEAFHTGADGKENLIYIEHAALRNRLNSAIGVGQWALITRRTWAEEYRTQKNLAATRIYVEAVLLIRGCFVAEAIGDMTYYPSNASQNYGDAVEGAKTAALRRCAKELGVGLQAWNKDFCEAWMRKYRGQRPPAVQANAPVTAPAPVVPQPAAVEAPRAEEKPLSFKEVEALMKASKEKFVRLCQPVEKAARFYMLEKGLIMPNEGIDAPMANALFPSVVLGMTLAQAQAAIGKDYAAHMAAIKTIVDGEVQPAPDDQVPGAEVAPEPAVIAASPIPDAPTASVDIPSGATRRSVIIKTVTQKSGAGKKGPWVRTGFVDAEGVWYNTFDKTLAAKANAMKGMRAVVWFTVDTYGNTFHEITPE